MVFSSPEFLLLFLPLSIAFFYLLRRGGHMRLSIAALFLFSLVYYAWWRPINIYIILVSIGANYLLGQKVSAAPHKKPWLVLGLAANLLSLGWFKYTDFAIGTVNTLTGTQIPLLGIILPIGISFFTFQQLAYLVDIYSGKHDAKGENFLDYCCFVCFFPQLVAGPIVHHAEMMPQFAANKGAVDWSNI